MSKSSRTAVLYRMVMPAHTCPWGLKARPLLKSRGYAVAARWRTTGSVSSIRFAIAFLAPLAPAEPR